MTNTVEATVEGRAVEAFAERMVGVLNDASLALMASIGHQVGLFDAMAGLAPATSDQIARTAQLHERYVREWLGVMTTAGVVVHDPADGTYHLPTAHAASLTRAAGPGNLAAVMQFIPLLATVDSSVVRCFREGGGVPYSEFHDFHRLMAEDSAALQDVALTGAIVPLVDGLAGRLDEGIDVADIGCGSGHAINRLAQTFPTAVSSAMTSPPRPSKPPGTRLRSSSSPTPRSKFAMSPTCRNPDGST